jgi:hypothetical protein
VLSVFAKKALRRLVNNELRLVPGITNQKQTGKECFDKSYFLWFK